MYAVYIGRATDGRDVRTTYRPRHGRSRPTRVLVNSSTRAEAEHARSRAHAWRKCGALQGTVLVVVLVVLVVVSMVETSDSATEEELQAAILVFGGQGLKCEECND